MTTEQAIKILNGAIKKPNIMDGYLGQAITMAINALKNQPVRCKDCVHCADDWNGNQPMFTCELGIYGGSVDPYYFCSMAELRGDNNGSD